MRFIWIFFVNITTYWPNCKSSDQEKTGIRPLGKSAQNEAKHWIKAQKCPVETGQSSLLRIKNLY